MFTLLLIVACYLFIGFLFIFFLSHPKVNPIIGIGKDDLTTTIFLWPIVAVFLPFVFWENANVQEKTNNWLHSVMEKLR